MDLLTLPVQTAIREWRGCQKGETCVRQPKAGTDVSCSLARVSLRERLTIQRSNDPESEV
jgi:hypothetical protein